MRLTPRLSGGGAGGRLLSTHTEEHQGTGRATSARHLTPRPSSTSSAAHSITKRVWNAPPADLFPDVPGSTSRGVSKKRAAAAVMALSAIVASDSSTKAVEQRATALTSRTQSAIPNPSTSSSAQRMSLVSPNRNRRLAGTGGGGASSLAVSETAPRVTSISGASAHRNHHSVVVAAADPSESKRVSFLTEVPESATRHSFTASVPRQSLAQISTSRSSRRPTSDTTSSQPQPTSPPSQAERKKHVATIASDLESRGSKREALKSAFVLKSMKRQDVDADDVRPLIEIAYWSPFLEVRRDAAAALASLSRNCT